MLVVWFTHVFILAWGCGGISALLLDPKVLPWSEPLVPLSNSRCWGSQTLPGSVFITDRNQPHSHAGGGRLNWFCPLQSTVLAGDTEGCVLGVHRLYQEVRLLRIETNHTPTQVEEGSIGVVLCSPGSDIVLSAPRRIQLSSTRCEGGVLGRARWGCIHGGRTTFHALSRAVARSAGVAVRRGRRSWPAASSAGTIRCSTEQACPPRTSMCFRNFASQRRAHTAQPQLPPGMGCRARVTAALRTANRAGGHGTTRGSSGIFFLTPPTYRVHLSSLQLLLPVECTNVCSALPTNL